MNINVKRTVEFPIRLETDQNNAEGLCLVFGTSRGFSGIPKGDDVVEIGHYTRSGKQGHTSMLREMTIREARDFALFILSETEAILGSE